MDEGHEVTRDDISEELGVPEVAAELDMNVSTVRQWIASGLLPARKDGRKWLVRRADLAAINQAPWRRRSRGRDRIEQVTQPTTPVEAWDELATQRQAPVPIAPEEPLVGDWADLDTLTPDVKELR